MSDDNIIEMKSYKDFNKVKTAEICLSDEYTKLAKKYPKLFLKSWELIMNHITADGDTELNFGDALDEFKSIPAEDLLILSNFIRRDIQNVGEEFVFIMSRLKQM